jgi:hypothetical protein
MPANIGKARNVHVHAPVDMQGLALVIGVIGLAVITGGVVLWLLHVLVIVAEGIGFTVMGAGGVAGAVAWRRMKNRHEINRQLAQHYPAALPRARGALPPAAGDIHLHLPAGISAEEVAQIMQRRQLP